MFPYGNIQPVEIRRMESRPGTNDRLDFPNPVIAIGIPLLKHRDPALSTYRMDPMPPIVVGTPFAKIAWSIPMPLQAWFHP